MSSVSLDSRSHVKIAHSLLGKRSYVYYWSSLMNRTGQPTIHTYWEILKGIGSTFFELGSCEVWAQPSWLTVAITYLCIFFIFLYFYVLLFGIFPARSRLSPVFYRSIIVLAIGDLVVLFCSMRESVVQDCVLRSKPSRHMAWQSIGTFAIEMIVGSNFALSLSRTLTIFKYEKLSLRVSSFHLFLVITWSIFLGLMNHFSLVDVVYFQGNNYNDYFAFPFDLIRMPILFTEVCLTAVFYILSAAAIRSMLRMHSQSIFRSEMKLLVVSILIFLIELEFIYSTFWIGDYFKIGSPEFNANLDYTSRPFVTGLTPIIYMMCSSEVRTALLSSFPLRFCCHEPNKKSISTCTNTIAVKS